MSNTCIVLRDIERVSQAIANFLTTPASLTPAAVTDLVSQIELIRGAVRSLPLAADIKADFLNRLAQAQAILQAGVGGPVPTLTTVLQVLQLVALKVQTHPVPCTQGLTIVHPSNCFNTTCQCCH
ncbi:MAG TPA: hypothetical protein PLC07_00415 [Bacillota bacterium]|nr:hypothetical protein [Bacillota bacterium]HPT87382.1 hypothetical protein [Bacillota bacterium]